MLIEQCAYANRWRRVHPAAKALFAACAFAASLLTSSPYTLCLMAALVSCVTMLGAGIRPRHYLRAFLPPLLFLAVSCATLAVSFHWRGWNEAPFLFAARLDAGQMPRVAATCGRSLSCLAALLFLSLTTPMTGVIELLRRLKVPDVLLDIMTLCYRILFVFLESVRDIRTAQAARLGWSTNRLAFRSFGILSANLAIQVWQRAHALQLAAMSRANNGPLVFLDNEYPHKGRSLVVALAAGMSLMIVAMVFP